MTKLHYLIGATALICGVAMIASGTGDEGGMPDLNGAVAWLNSPPLSNKALRGKVVLVNSVLGKPLVRPVRLEEV